MPRAMGWDPLPTPPLPGDDVLAIVRAGLDGVLPDAAVLARFQDPAAVAERAALAARAREDDWPALAKYRAANAGVRGPDLVMIGDSLTEIWGIAMPEVFDRGIVNRGISGQTSAQMLLRFMPDVIDLQPRRVHILCGTNDVAGNTGPTLPDDYRRNVRAMIALARVHGVEVLLGTVPPARAMFWQPQARPREFIPLLNAWLRDVAAAEGLGLVDYHAALNDGDGGLAAGYSADGVHVTRAAYHDMTGLMMAGMSGRVY